jgi:ABC-type polysaccharide/polyol phosphate export permease
MSQSIIAFDPHAGTSVQALPNNCFRLARYLAKVRLTLWVRDRWLGLWWWLLQPMAMCATYVFMFRYAFPCGKPNHALFIMCALLPWTCFIAATGQAGAAFVGNKNLLKSFRFNYLALPLAEVMAATVRFVCSLIVIGILMAYYDIAPTAHLLWMPLLVAVQFVFTLGVCYFLAVSEVFIQDTPNAWQVVSRIWFYASPSLYALDTIMEKIPADYQFVYLINPFATLFNSYRLIIIEGKPPEFWMLAYVTLLGGVILAAAMLLIRRLHGVLPMHV